MDIRHIRAELSESSKQRAAQEAASVAAQEAASVAARRKPKKSSRRTATRIDDTTGDVVEVTLGQESRPEYPTDLQAEEEAFWREVAEEEGYEESQAERNVREEYTGRSDTTYQRIHNYAGRTLLVTDRFREGPWRPEAVPELRTITDIDYPGGQAYHVYPNPGPNQHVELARNLAGAVLHLAAHYGAEYRYSHVVLRGQPPAPPPTRSMGPTKFQRAMAWTAIISALVSIGSVLFTIYTKGMGAQ